jgi:ferric-dicitrate binding protein FerR (iron transport regulator)
MFARHVVRELSAYHHGELSASDARRVEGHLETCAKCREAHDEIRFGARLASTLTVSNAPAAAWKDIQQASEAPVRRRTFPRAAMAGALAIVATLVVLIYTRSLGSGGPAWDVTGLPGTAQIRSGETLETDSTSSAQIKIANIGQLTVDPNSKIRLLVTQPDEHRIALDRGRIEARTWAPPRLFIVETPSANAVDLGCRYTLEVEEDGGSLLHVTLGLVALDRGGIETVVPAGAFCRTHSAKGPDTPFFEDSSAEFQAALYKVDSLAEGPERTKQLEIVLRESRVRDALSLWHLIPRMDASARGLLYDRLAQLLPPPSGVTRDGIMRLDPAMLDSWKTIVSQLWQ